MDALPPPETDTHRWEDALASLDAGLRQGCDPAELARVGIDALAQALNPSRAGWGELSADGQGFTVLDDWTAPGWPSLAGPHRIAGHTGLARLQHRGRAAVVDDVREDGLAPAESQAMEAVGIRARLGLPVTDGERAGPIFFVHAPEPRQWTVEETCFARLAVERVARAIERRQSEQKLHELAWTLEQRVAERTEALRDSQDFTRLALTATGGVGVWTYEVASDRFFCDASVSDLYGIDAEEGAAGILRTRFLANVHPDDVPKLRATMSGGLERSGDLELEYRLVHPDGKVRWVLSRGHTYFDADNRPVRRTGVGVETTRQRQLEEQLRQAQKMESLGQLTGGIAHDFNNLLQGVVLPLQIAQKRLAQQQYESIGKHIEASMAAARRAAGLTQRLLAFARRQPLDSRTVALDASLAGLEPMLRNTCGVNIALEVEMADGLGPVVTDQHQFESAILNLTINARDAMPAGGTLRITAENLWLQPADAKGPLAELTPGDYVRVTVADTGTGMPASVIERAFDPFFTTKPIGQGTGLGLSMVYGYARQSGGIAVIGSSIGQGTRIALYFPRASETQALPAADTMATERAPAGKRVLVVEDDETVRRYAVELLQTDGFVVSEAVSGHQAMRLLEVQRDFDLLLSDVGLPGPNGRQVAELARERIPGIRIVLMTGYAEEAAHRNVFIDSGMELLVKPFDADALVDKVRQALSP
ncbi:response regulator [Xylophilus rhododendri]|uniref:histidine kinase n=1 Tax=Xylophilus rhododendri TaxID=2697032 RepID=A0A857JCC6_9BURK|nr:response regulator [Xylophilus rhododendri]QHJ00389.1 response regulator [Xylophilus rhododendri]